MATITNNAVLKIMTFKEASGKLENPLCCFTLKILQCHLALSPKHIGGFLAGIQKRLDEKLLIYSNEYGGVPIVFKGSKVEQSTGWMMDDRPEIHLNVTTQCIIFNPTVGSHLVGVVNKMGPAFIGCLVHGAFNATLRTGRQQEMGVDVGSEVEMEVTELHFTRGILCLSGRLVRVLCSSLLDALVPTLPPQATSSSRLAPIAAPLTKEGLMERREGGENPAGDLGSSGKKKKRKRKSSEGIEVMPVDVSAASDVVAAENGCDISILDDSGLSEAKKKKKKKHKHKEQDD